jgi:hypothetical protein
MREKIYGGLAAATFTLGLAFLGLDGNFAASRRHYNFFDNRWAYAVYLFFTAAIVFAALTLKAWKTEHRAKSTQRRVAPDGEPAAVDEMVARAMSAPRATVGPRVGSYLARVAAGQEEPPPSSIAEAASGGAPVLSPSARTVARQEARTLQQEGDLLHSELFPLITTARRNAAPLGFSHILPAGYVERTVDWNARFFAFAQRHLTEREMTDVEPHPSSVTSFMGGAKAALLIRDQFDTMFKTNLALAARIQARL